MFGNPVFYSILLHFCNPFCNFCFVKNFITVIFYTVFIFIFLCVMFSNCFFVLFFCDCFFCHHKYTLFSNFLFSANKVCPTFQHRFISIKPPMIHTGGDNQRSLATNNILGRKESSFSSLLQVVKTSDSVFGECVIFIFVKQLQWFSKSSSQVPYLV